jgi:hypothetical protein
MFGNAPVQVNNLGNRMIAKKKLLAATVSENISALQAVYESHFDIKIVTQLEAAVDQLDAGVDVILCNINFDEGALYDLLRIAKAHEVVRTAPFIAIDASPVASSAAIRQSIDIACKTLGAAEVIHMTPWREQVGDVQAIRKVLDIIKSHING